MATTGYYFKKIVMQPTTLCNLDCEYCYLPDKLEPNKMSYGVAEAVAESIKNTPYEITILWHGGEPLAVGTQHFRKLIEPFEKLRLAGKIKHNVQVNGTMISPDWCRLFKEKDIEVGLSIDGPENCNVNRVNRASMPAWDRVMKGVGLLKINRIPFGVIAVVSDANIRNARSFYEFFSSLGSRNLCVNIAESEGVNMEKNHLGELEVKLFWQELFEAWKANPQIRIREFDKSLAWMDSSKTLNGTGQHVYRDLLPTVAWNGDVVMLSPEFLSVEHEGRGRFVVGNILDNPLGEIVEDSLKVDYVKDYFSGIRRCAAECRYFGFCGGGQASNKFFELGKIDATITEECRNTRMLLLDSVSESAARDGKNAAEVISSLPEKLRPPGYPGFKQENPESLLRVSGAAGPADECIWSDWSDREG